MFKTTTEETNNIKNHCSKTGASVFHPLGIVTLRVLPSLIRPSSRMAASWATLRESRTTTPSQPLGIFVRPSGFTHISAAMWPSKPTPCHVSFARSFLNAPRGSSSGTDLRSGWWAPACWKAATATAGRGLVGKGSEMLVKHRGILW